MNKRINIVFSLIKRIIVLLFLAVLIICAWIWIQYDFSTQALIQHFMQFDRTQLQKIDRTNSESVSQLLFDERLANEFQEIKTLFDQQFAS
jgi:hypothetical protein